MAECPKCKQHLRLTDWRQNCPHCGANIVLYDHQERLMRDADKAEVEYYHFQKKIDRLKASFVGSKLAIVRIVTSILPIAALFLPVVKLTLNAPFEPFSESVTALTVYNNIEKIDVGLIMELIGNGETKLPALLFAAGAVGLLLSVVVLLLHLLLLTLACSPKGKPRNYAMNVLWLIFAALVPICAAAVGNGSVISASPGIGSWVYIALIAVNFVVEILIFRQGIEVRHKQCYVGGIPIEEYFEMQKNGASPEELRSEMYKRLSAMQKEKEAEIEKLAEKKVSI